MKWIERFLIFVSLSCIVGGNILKGPMVSLFGGRGYSNYRWPEYSDDYAKDGATAESDDYEDARNTETRDPKYIKTSYNQDYEQHKNTNNFSDDYQNDHQADDKGDYGKHIAETYEEEKQQPDSNSEQSKSKSHFSDDYYYDAEPTNDKKEHHDTISSSSETPNPFNREIKSYAEAKKPVSDSDDDYEEEELTDADKPIYDLKNAKELFTKFKKDYNKQYKDSADEMKHFENFIETLKEINAQNSKPDSSYSMDITEFADWGDEENDSVQPFGEI